MYDLWGSRRRQGPVRYQSGKLRDDEITLTYLRCRGLKQTTDVRFDWVTSSWCGMPSKILTKWVISRTIWPTECRRVDVTRVFSVLDVTSTLYSNSSCRFFKYFAGRIKYWIESWPSTIFTSVDNIGRFVMQCRRKPEPRRTPTLSERVALSITWWMGLIGNRTHDLGGDRRWC
jgi:hypothetical protein